ncbi:uncharacterized protein LOC112689426 isoform X2 [Sipha flava]|uniref:Uncharacterized protein LOC112689426 isoform X2 n=1 Tax=Sipha flava TaxID=143950 RepID=A0A8B8G7U4_9HEMI|nr:uncharacterized protein LOC112689426 isoform X2 [Sipha flava]
MDENTTILFDIFFNRVIITFKELFNGQLNNTMIDKFNTSCKDDLECQDVALFCNLTSSLCQCATFYLRNENAGICEFQQTNLTSWLKTNGTTETWKHIVLRT